MFIPRSHSNPVLHRELRVRWRGGRLPLALLGFSALLSIGMVFLYFTVSPQQANWVRVETRTVGRPLFYTLSLTQLVLWLLIAPLLTATSISSERERGMLEAMQLSRMSAGEIVAGKFVSVLSSIFLMTLTATPIVTICLLLGGVSPVEFLQVMLLNFVTACTGAAFGLACSAWSRRANTSIPLTYFCVALWLSVTAAFLAITLVTYWPDSATGRPYTPFYGLFGFNLFDATSPHVVAIAVNTLAFENPFVTMTNLMDPETAAELSQNVFFAGINPMTACLTLQTGLILLLLRLATQGTRKIFPDQPMQQRKRVLGLRRKSGRLKFGWQPAWEAAGHSTSRFLTGNENINEETQGASEAIPPRPSWHSVPMLSWIHFSNPILHREFHNKFRLRFSKGLAALGFFIVVPLAFLYVVWGYEVLHMRGPNAVDTVSTLWCDCIFAGLALGSFIMAVMSAKAFAREKETGSWEALHLSLLPRRQIITGKLLAPIAFCTMLALPWFVLLFAGVRHVTPVYSSDEYIIPDYNKVSLVQGLGAIWILYGTLFFCGAVGLWISWHCRRTIAAISWTLGVLIGGWVLVALAQIPLFRILDDGFPYSDWANIIYIMMFGKPSGNSLETPSYLANIVLNIIHPFFGAASLFSRQWYGEFHPNVFTMGFICGLVQFSLAAIILWHLHRSMHRRESEALAHRIARVFSIRKPAMQN